MTLWIIFAVMTAAAFTFLLRPFLKPGEKSSQKPVEADIYKDQLQELERDVEDGLVSSEATKTEISRRILDSVASSKKSKSVKSGSAPHKKLVVFLLILVPVMSLSI